MELKDTIVMMESTDYKERLKAEFCQLVCRYDKLTNMLDRWDKGELSFEPTCPKDILVEQARVMARYIELLKERAEFENIEFFSKKG